MQIPQERTKRQQQNIYGINFVTYYICNYLPNIEGVDTQFITDAINATGWNSQAVVTWQKALNGLVDDGELEKIGTSSSNVGAMMTYMNYTPRTLEEILEANPAPEFKRDLRKLSEELK